MHTSLGSKVWLLFIIISHLKVKILAEHIAVMLVTPFFNTLSAVIPNT